MFRKTKPCPACGNRVSKTADVCPLCGHKTAGMRLGCSPGVIIVGAVIGMFGLMAVFDGSAPPPKRNTSPAPTVRKAMTDQEKIEAQFSAWDGSHRALTTYIKKRMNNPASFEHVETGFKKDADGNLLVKTVFRGTNSFGAVVTNQVVARVDLDGNVLKIVSSAP